MTEIVILFACIAGQTAAAQSVLIDLLKF